MTADAALPRGGERPRTPAKIERVTYYGTYDASYSRNRILIEGLRSCGVQVEECHEDLYGSTAGKLRAASGNGFHLVGLFFRAVRIQLRLISRVLRMPASEVVILGYSAQIDVFAAWVLTRLRGGVLVADIMTPLWLICRERYPAGVPWLTKLIVRTVEKAVIRFSDVALVETRDVAEFLAREYGVPATRFTVLPVGADPAIASRMAGEDAGIGGIVIPSDAFVVLYFGKFIPQHGMETILAAARSLRDAGETSVLFVLAGEGQESATVRDSIGRQGLQHVLTTGHVGDADLSSLIRRADVCLGVFGTSQQSRITAHNKIFEALLMGKPLISGKSKPIEQLFRDGEELLLVDRGDGRGLAEAILRLKADPAQREHLARGAAAALQRGGYLPKALAQRLLDAVREHQAGLAEVQGSPISEGGSR